MEKEICISNDLTKKLNEIADLVKQQYGSHIWFVEILGRRHSYIAGHREDNFLPPEVVYLNERYAIVSNEWEKIYEKDEIILKIKSLLGEQK